jgi:biopolymer transport protein ExbB
VALGLSAIILSAAGASNDAAAGMSASSVSSVSPSVPKLARMGSWGEKLKQGGRTAWVQIGLSVFGAGFIFERLFRLRRKHLVPPGLAARARELWAAGKFNELEQLGETEPSTFARVISFIAKNRRSSMVELSQICGELVSRELSGHYQRAYPLGIVATLAPLLGLLGMILGMIETFETVAMAGSLGDATQLAAGISEALVTTALGLAIAIPFLALYHVFKFRTAGFGAQLEEEVTSLLTAWFLKEQDARVVRGEQSPSDKGLAPSPSHAR